MKSNTWLFLIGLALFILLNMSLYRLAYRSQDKEEEITRLEKEVELWKKSSKRWEALAEEATEALLNAPYRR